MTRSTEVLGINRRNLDLVYCGYRPGDFQDLDDKLRTKWLLEDKGVACPATLGLICDRHDLDDLGQMLAPHREIVIKPTKGSGGKGILVLRAQDEGWITPGGRLFSLDALRGHIIEILSGHFSLDEVGCPAILEERLYPHDFLAQLYSDGLADLRVVLHRGVPLQAMWRVPTSQSHGKANLHGGGIGMGVDLATGTTLSATCKGRTVRSHPDTRVPLVGLRTPQWKNCLELARRASSITDVTYVGVDITLDHERGPLILELNARPGLEIQVANQTGQPVPPPTPSRLGLRFTFVCAWLLLGTLALSPLLARWEHDRWQRSLEHRSLESLSEIPTSPQGGAVESGVEWADVETPVSERSQAFAQARAAEAAGQIDRAHELYNTAMADSSVIPFALNNKALLWRQKGKLKTAQRALEQAVELYPTYYRGHYNLGLILSDRGLHQASLAAFDQTLSLRPSHAGAWAKRGDVLRGMGDLPLALEAYEQAIRFEPSSRRYRVKQGLALRDAREFAAAIASFEVVLQLQPDHEPALYWLGRTQLDTRRSLGITHAQADSLYEQLMTRAHPATTRARTRALMGRWAWRAHRLSDAYMHFESARADGLRPGFYGSSAALMALELGLWDQATSRFEGLLGEDKDFARHQLRSAALGRALSDDAVGTLVDPRHAATLGVLAAQESSIASPAEAVPTWLDLESRLIDKLAVPASLAMWARYCRQAAAGDPDAAVTLSSIETSHPEFQPLLLHRFWEARATNEHDRASELGYRMLEMQPRNVPVLRELAALALDANDLAAARGLLYRLSDGERSQIEVQVVMARLHQAEGHLGRAIGSIKDVIRHAPSNLEARVLLAELHFEKGNLEKGILQLRTVLDSEPDRLEIRREVARRLMEVRRYGDAVREWRRVTKLDGETTSTMFNLALSLQRDGQDGLSIEFYDRVLQAEPTRHRAHYNRALALERTGQLDQAAQGYREVLRLKPDHEASFLRLARLEQTR